MKKILMTVVVLAVMGFVGCQKDDSDVGGKINVNFSVAEKPSLDNDTRAVKTGWENGDEILIAVQSNDGWYDENGYNCFKLKYNGSVWTPDMTGFNATKTFETGNYYVAIYHPGTITLGSFSSDLQYLTGYKGGEHLADVNSTYTKTADGIDLGVIELSRYSQDFQISVKDLASAGKANGTWKLYIQDTDGNKAHNMYFSAADNAFLRSTGFGTYSSNYSTGINYKGDVVFYLTNAGSNETSLVFKLTDGTDTYTYTTTTIPEMGKAYYLPAITNAKWQKMIE